MTTPSSCDPFPFTSWLNHVVDVVGKSRWKTACATFVLCGAIAPAQTFRTVARFGPQVSASVPVQGIDGNFYGTTSPYSGVANGGTFFKLTRAGVLATLYSFCTQAGCPDGSEPGGVVEAVNGSFYGTTFSGGPHGNGTVFHVTPSGTLTTVYGFCPEPGCVDGAAPTSVILGTDGNLYGTTSGTFDYGFFDNIFKVTPGGTETVLATIEDPHAGARLSFEAADGDFYRITTLAGFGAFCNDPEFGCGSVFKVTPGGELMTLYAFCAEANCTDGRGPTSLILAANGDFYGTTLNGGANGIDGGGTVFRLTPGGTLTTLYSFSTGSPTGLIQATDGYFYGTTADGGTNEKGTVFKITPAGTLTTLYSFCASVNCTDGVSPEGLFQATSGTFYGTTQSTGSSGNGGGTIFSLCTGLGWFVETLPNTSTVGSTVKILGTDLTGATHVSFTGNTARFTVVSPTEINAIVPAGVTTGYVKVTLPSGRIPSNQPFHVMPQITSFTPSSGPVETVVTVTGVGLAQTTQVTIGGVSSTFTIVNSTTVTSTVPTMAVTGKISVTTQGGTATTATNFTVD